jgi:hypothetical protein
LREEHYDIVIVGASLGGVAAALRASALGANVCLLEASSWAGGQYSGQGLTRGDDNQYVDQGTSGARGVGSTALYRRFREGARAFYSGSFALSAQGKAMKPFDPGAPTQHFATNLRIAPRAAHDVLLAMLAGTHPAVTVRLQTPIHAAELAGNRVTAVRARPFYGVETRYHASFFLDATDLGELLPLANVPHRVGAESTAQTGEPFTPATPQPAWLQPNTVPIALELRPPGENHTIPKPDFYDEIVAVRKFAPHFTSIFRITADDSLFNYRQFIAKDNFADPAFPYDVTTINDDQNDYTVRSIPSGNPAQDAQTIAAARARSVAYAYYLQTAIPREDGAGFGYPNLRVATEVFGTADGTAPLPYIRESRRIEARTTIVRQDLFVAGDVRAKHSAETCGIGHYRLDMHVLANGMSDGGGGNPGYFQIPLGALIAPAVVNLLPACKNLGVTHITNGAYRVHPIEWAVGEAAGALAAFCLKRSVTPSNVLDGAPLAREFRHAQLDAGMPLCWWTDVSFDDDPALFAATQLTGARGWFADPASLEFGPKRPLDSAQRAAIETSVGSALPWPSPAMTRGDAARWLVGHLGL